MKRNGSLVKTIDELNAHQRGLRTIGVRVDKGKVEPVWGTEIFDPARPYRPLLSLRKRLIAIHARFAALFAKAKSGHQALTDGKKQT
jgi:hypothetical protein